MRGVPPTVQNAPRERKLAGPDALWVGRNRDNRHLAFLRTVAPKDAISGGRPMLDVRLEDLLIRVIRVRQRMEHVRPERGMPRVRLQVAEGLFDLFDQPQLAAVGLQLVELSPRAPCEDELKHHSISPR